MVGVNLDRRGQVAECDLIERAILDRPLLIWTMPFVHRMAAEGRHVNGALYFLGDHVMLSGAGGADPRLYAGVFFEAGRLRPLSGRFNSPESIISGRMPPYEFAFAYDAPIPDFLASPACQADESVRMGYPAEINQLFGGAPPGAVRIARKTTVNGATSLLFALVADRPLAQVAEAAQSAVLSAWGGALEGGKANATRIYGYPAVAMAINRGLSRLDLDVLQIAPDKVIVRGAVSRYPQTGGKQ